ncbi:Matrix-remodeling-associated protein 8 [Turdus rufiventris]|nr:Matrix-remodeling-associated protein 8 [Turdus rufiventris]
MKNGRDSRSSVCSYSVPADASNPSSVVVSVLNISAVLGSQAVLPCKSHRMVWTQDRLNDRQRVVHWDLLSSYYGDSRMDRLCDMYSAGDQRVYSSYNKGRILMPENAFADGNFSLVIKGVAESDEGTYSCNLHHHYCHLYETVKIQLVVAKRGEQASEYWDGEKPVLVAPKGSTVTLPCVNRQHIWTERHSEEEQQVVHWDRQPPGVPQDRADRLVDLYASGERRSYGPQFVRQKMNVSSGAFALGDFSLRISQLESADEGTYSCHLHHHYCGLHERRIYHVRVMEPQGDGRVGNSTRSLAPAAGYEYNVKKYGEKDVNLKEFTVDTTDLTPQKSEDIRLDYKNNILKEKAEQARSFPAKNIDLDKAQSRSDFQEQDDAVPVPGSGRSEPAMLSSWVGFSCSPGVAPGTQKTSNQRRAAENKEKRI